MDANTETHLKQFLHERTAVIADPSSSATSLVSRCLSELGLKRTNIFKARDFHSAKETIEKNRPDLLFVDYNVGEHSGIELIEYSRQVHNIESLDQVVVLITANADESAVSDAAEEDVDNYIIKPVSQESLTEVLAQTIAAKMNPSNYLCTISAGKQALRKRDSETAIQLFGEAKSQKEQPALACAYLGDAYTAENRFEEALTEYDEGLSYIEFHYRCLAGKFRILFSQKKYDEAYKIFLILSSFFPVSPQRLGMGFQAAVYTRHFDHADNLLSTFEILDYKPKSLVKIVSASLVAFGKLKLKHQGSEGVLALFKKATLYSGKSLDIIVSGVQALMSCDKHSEAFELLSMASADDKNSAKYLEYEFLYYHHKKSTRDILEIGMRLVEEKCQNPVVYQALLDELSVGGKERLVNKVFETACDVFPDARERFSRN